MTTAGSDYDPICTPVAAGGWSRPYEVRARMAPLRKLLPRLLPVVLALAGSAGLTLATGTTHAAAAASPPHVMVIVEENAAYNQSRGNPYIVNNPDAQYINNTLINTYTSLANWYSVEHVSTYDYRDLISGSDQKGLTKPFNSTTFVDQLAARNISWKAYLESMPSSCYAGNGNGLYDATHNPYVQFKSILQNPSQCQNVVPYTQSQLTTDLNGPSAPSFISITPNQCNDMHTKCSPTNNPVKQGDVWLSGTIPTVQSTQWYKSGGIIIVTWDESAVADTSGVPGTGDNGGQVATVVISAANHSSYSAAGDHFGTLRGLQNAYGVGCLAGSCQAGHGDISGAFPGASPGSIAGTVTDSGTSSGISGATVTCAGCPTQTATTTGSGGYAFSGVTPGGYSLSFSAPGYASRNNVPVTVSAGQQTKQDQALTRASALGSIAGTVTDATTKSPLGGATVTCAACPTTTATTDSLGGYTFSSLPSGSYNLSFSAPGYASQNNVPVTVSAGQQTTQDQALVPAHQTIFSDGFESGSLSGWTSSVGLATETNTVHSGGYAAQGTVTSSAGDARETLPSTYSSGYERVWFDMAGQSSQVYVLQANTSANTNVATVYVSSKGILGVQAADTTRHDSTTAVIANSWHELELRFSVNGTASSIDVWLDGVDVLSLPSINLKTTPVAVMQIGDATPHSWSAIFDDAAFDNQFIP